MHIYFFLFFLVLLANQSQTLFCFRVHPICSPRIISQMRLEWNCHGWDVELKKASNFLVWRLITCNTSPAFSPLNGEFKGQFCCCSRQLFHQNWMWRVWHCPPLICGHSIGRHHLLWILRPVFLVMMLKDWVVIPDWFFFLLGLRLRPSYAQYFYHALPSSNTASAPKVLLLAGDAAISHHFWPGRGLNTGLKSAVAIVKMWQRNEPFLGIDWVAWFSSWIACVSRF